MATRSLLAAAILFWGSAHAGPDFELYGLDGRLVRLSELPPQPTLVNFWHGECPPCRRELPLLTRFAEEMPAVRVITVAVQDRAATEADARLLPRQGINLVAPLAPQGLLRRFGNLGGALPYTVVLNPAGGICRRHAGEVGRIWLEKAAHDCGAPGSAPTQSVP